MISWEDVTLTVTYDPAVGHWKLVATAGSFVVADYLEDFSDESLWAAVQAAWLAFNRLGESEGVND